MTLYSHLSTNYSAPVCLPGLELWGPAHCALDNGDHFPRFREGNRLSNHCLRISPGCRGSSASPQAPREFPNTADACLDSGLALSPGPPRGPDMPFIYGTFSHGSSYGKEHSWVEWQDDYFLHPALTRSRKELRGKSG